MKLQTESLIEALSAIALIPSRAGVTPSEFIRLQKVKDKLRLSLSAEVYGTTWASGVVDKKEADWLAYVDRASFQPFVYAARDLRSKSDFEFSMDAKSGTLHVRQGRRRAEFSKVDEIEGYAGKSAQGDELKSLKLTDQQKAWLTLASKYASPDPTVAHLNCVCLVKGKAILASNDLAIALIEDKVIPMTVSLPVQLLSALGSSHAKALVVKKGFSRIDLDCGWLCQLPNAKAAEDFPRAQILEAFEKATSYTKRAVIDGGVLLSMLKRLQDYIALVVKRDLVVEVTAQSGEKKVTFECKAPQGSFRESVIVEYPVKTDIRCEWLMSHLLPLAETASSLGDLHIHYEDDPKTPFYFKSKQLRLLIAKKV